MKGMLRAGVALCALVGVVATAEAKAKCYAVRAQGEGLTKELATEMAKINLNFSIAAKGTKATGPVRVSCSPGAMVLTSCVAQQRAC